MANLRTALRRVPLGSLVFEIFVIVVGVLAALALNDWRDARKQAELERTALRAIGGELRRNVELLDHRIPYHESILEASEAALSRFFVEEAGSYRLRDPDRVPSRFDLGFERGKGLGIGGGVVADNAWTAARSSGALTGLRWDLFYQLSNTYTALDQLRRTVERFDALERLDTAYFERRDVLSAASDVRWSMVDLVLRERELKREAVKALELIRTGQSPPPERPGGGDDGDRP